MPIQTIESRDSAPIIGTIRLGVKVKTQSGSERPDNADHFVIHDAPQLERVYGVQPKEIDVIFPSDDLEQCIPTWLMWWRPGARDAKGKAISGVLRCKGNGPAPTGEPGVAEYFDKRDPKTGLVPTRPCLGQQCPDAKDARGNPQCKASMQIFIFLPKVSPFGVFKISTTSWTTVKSLYDQLTWLKKINNGKITGICFKLVKEQRSFVKFDGNGRETKMAQWVVVLKPNEKLEEIAGMQQSIQLLSQSTVQWQAPAQQLEAPVADVPHLDVEAEETAQKLISLEELLKDPEVVAYFTRLEQVMGSAISGKDRMIMARKHEKKDNPKAALLEAIAAQGKALAAKAKPAAAAPPPEEQAAPAQEAVVVAQPEQSAEPMAAAGPDTGGLI